MIGNILFNWAILVAVGFVIGIIVAWVDRLDW